jgi:hypothetical protein
MKIKVKFLDKQLRKEYYLILSIISVIFSIIFIVVEIPEKYKLRTGISLIAILIIWYIFLWVRANLLQISKLQINNSNIEVRVGDIFEEKDLKVIAFNEYFDTQVDDKIISKKTLNGIYINKMIRNTTELDNSISTDMHLKNNVIDYNSDRLYGKKYKYKLGSIFQNNDYLLTAFSKFDEDNTARLTMPDYINFLLDFWNEIDIIYAGRSVAIPLLGSGITRFKDYEMITNQELLELLIWSFKVSRIKFTYQSKISIIIHQSEKDKINFYKLKEWNYEI